jgi:hypothetical protein
MLCSSIEPPPQPQPQPQLLTGLRWSTSNSKHMACICGALMVTPYPVRTRPVRVTQRAVSIGECAAPNMSRPNACRSLSLTDALRCVDVRLFLVGAVISPIDCPHALRGKETEGEKGRGGKETRTRDAEGQVEGSTSIDSGSAGGKSGTSATAFDLMSLAATNRSIKSLLELPEHCHAIDRLRVRG